MTGAPWRTLVLLIAASAFSFLDRQILSLLVPALKRDWGLSDFALGALQGVAFAVFYAVAAVPIGWLADRANRARLLAAGIALWSVCTAASGLASGLAGLFAARLGVGVGEAVLTPTATSLLAALFPGPRLPLALGWFGVGVPAGAALAYVAGGAALKAADGAPGVTIGPLAWPGGWHLVFPIVGLPGLVLAGLCLVLIPEPARARPARLPPLAPFVRPRAGLAAWLVTGLGLITAAGFASLFWLPGFLARAHGWPAPRAALLLGAALLLLNAPGGVLCGALSARLRARGVVEAPLLVMAGAALVGGVASATAYLAPGLPLFLVALAPAMAAGGAIVGLGPAAVQALTPAALRGRISAWQLLLTGLAGQLLGPPVVGALTDRLLGEAGLGTALALVAGGGNLAGAACLIACRRRYRAAALEG